MRRSEGNPRVSHSAKDPVTLTVEVSGLTTKGSRGMPDDEAMALGAGFSMGTGAGAISQGHVNSLISPKTFTSSLKKQKAENLLVLRGETLV